MCQDALLLFGNGKILTGNKQSSGNSNASGLEFKKFDVQNSMLAVAVGFMQEAYEAAILTGRKDWFVRKIQRFAEKAAGGPTMAMVGTFLEDLSTPCERDRSADSAGRKSKRCATHGHPNWVECRNDRKRENFER